MTHPTGTGSPERRTHNSPPDTHGPYDTMKPMTRRARMSTLLATGMAASVLLTGCHPSTAASDPVKRLDEVLLEDPTFVAIVLAEDGGQASLSAYDPTDLEHVSHLRDSCTALAVAVDTADLLNPNMPDTLDDYPGRIEVRYVPTVHGAVLGLRGLDRPAIVAVRQWLVELDQATPEPQVIVR